MSSILVVQEGTQEQSANEKLPWAMDVSNFGDSPTSPTAVAIDETTDTTVTSTVFPTNSPSVSSNTITLSPLQALTIGHLYKIKVLFTIGDATYEPCFFVKCTM